jgi:hypothetical protein
MCYTGQHGAVLGMTTFGFTTARVVELATAQVTRATGLLAGAVR